jgi:hypothetical protein
MILANTQIPSSIRRVLRQALVSSEVPYAWASFDALQTAGIAHNLQVTNTRPVPGHDELQEVLLRGTRPSGSAPWDRSRTSSLFLSGYDLQERRPLYFLCQLPRSADPTTVADAYEVLKPAAIKLAEKEGRAIIRQGDIYAVRMPTVTTDDLLRKGYLWRTGRRGRRLLGTNHEATEVMLRPSHSGDFTTGLHGTVMARGKLIHAPTNRRADHSPKNLGNAWHLIMKNTVPIA